MNRTKSTLAAASILLALTFIFSCTSDNDGEFFASGQSSSSSETVYCGSKPYDPSTQFCSDDGINDYGFITDARNRKTYKTVVIGTQTWMAENLNYNAGGSKCADNKEANCAKYGRLYYWATAMGGAGSSNESPSGVQGICPSGWHLPSYDEWRVLIDFVGGFEAAASKLKAASGWDNFNGTDDYGFSALYGHSSWWSACGSYFFLYGEDEAHINTCNSTNISYGDLNNVRCLKDYQGTRSSSSSLYGSSSSSSGGSSSSSSGWSSSSDEISSSSSEEEEASVWVWSNQKSYTVTDGVVDSVSLELSPTWASYIDDKHYEQQYGYTIPINSYSETDEYTLSIVGISLQLSISSSRNGSTMQSVSHQITDYTASFNYKDPNRENTTTRTASDYTTTSTYTYDEESGLVLSVTSTQVGTNNGNPVNTSTTTNYTIVPLSTGGDVKTYRHYAAATATGAYSEYKMQNGVTLEQKSYTAEGVLSVTVTYEFPDNTTIREKLPTFTLYNYTYETTPASNQYQTCDVVSESPTEFTIRVKTYSAATGNLTGQTETTYTKRN